MGLLSKAAVKTADLATTVEEIGQRLKKRFNSDTSLQGIVLEIPPDFRTDKGVEDFNAMINRIIALLGFSLALPSGRVLAIFPPTADRELIARQLEKSLNTKALAVFTAEEPSKALEYIGPYL
jgi:hypothetical protein